MPYFLDSNVIIGYIFFTTDHWGRAAVRAVEDPEPNHSGSAVRCECFGLGDTDLGKVRTIRKNVTRALQHVIFRLKRGQAFDRIIADPDGNERIFKILADVKVVATGNPHRKVDEVVFDALRAFEVEVGQRQKIVEKRCLWHRRITYYPDISALLRQHISDDDDITVLLDAHDIALTLPGLVYVSGDYNHIVQHADWILAHTRIMDVLPLGRFTEQPT